MELKESRIDNILVLEVSGRILSLSDSEEFKAKIRELIGSGSQQFVVDLKGVEITNTMGLSMLVGAYISTQRAGGRLVLACIDNISELLVMTRLTELFDIYDSREEALESFPAAT